MKKIMCLVLAIALCLCFAACGKTATTTDVKDNAESSATSTGDLKYITDKGEMVIGITMYEPMNYKEDGKLVGFDTEFAEAVCKKLGVKANFVEIDWDNKFLELESKSIDCIWNGMTITDEVKLNSSVSKPYVKNAQVVVMNKENASQYSKVEDLKGLKFVAEAGSAGESAIKDSGLDEQYVAVSAQTDALLEVKSGSADACVIDITMAKAMTGEGTSYDNLATVLELTSEEYGIAFRKNSDVTKDVDAIIDDLKADGTLNTLAEKYKLTLAF